MNIQPDLFIYSPDGSRYMIDVSIISPDSDSSVQQLRSNTKPLAAAEHRAKVKHSDYDTLAHDNSMSFIPFILETHGAISGETKEFLRLLSKNAAAPAQFYIYALRRLSVALQRANARVQAEGSSLLSFRGAGSSSMVEIVGALSLSASVSGGRRGGR